MGYKLLGFVVWHGGRWYLRRRIGAMRARIAIAAVSTAALAGLIAAARQVSRR